MNITPIFKAEVTDEVSVPTGQVLGQLIYSHGEPYIVVETRQNESYQEQSGVHYKIGGFVKVKPDTIKYLNPETHRLEEFNP